MIISASVVLVLVITSSISLNQIQYLFFPYLIIIHYILDDSGTTLENSFPLASQLLVGKSTDLQYVIRWSTKITRKVYL